MTEMIHGLNEDEQKILITLACALPKMREFDKGYLLAMSESMAIRKEAGEIGMDSVCQLKNDESVQAVKS